MESTRATTNTMVEPMWVKPSDFPKATAHTDSMNPDAMSTSQLTSLPFPDRAGRATTQAVRAPRLRFSAHSRYSSITMVGLSRVMICLAKMSAPRYCCTMAAS